MDVPASSGIISFNLSFTTLKTSIPMLRIENSPWNVVLTLPAASSDIINPFANDSIAIARFMSVCPVAGGNTASNPPFMAWNIFDNASNAATIALIIVLRPPRSMKSVTSLLRASADELIPSEIALFAAVHISVASLKSPNISPQVSAQPDPKASLVVPTS